MTEQLQSFLQQLIPVTLSHLHREYPNGLLHHLQTAADARPPAQLHPAFYGCYDWHSAVHSHWQVVRALRVYPNAPYAPEAIAALNRSFTAENLAGELTYLQPRPGFEMPYGMAWLLQLLAELREPATQQIIPQAATWQALLAALEAHAAQRFAHYLDKLPSPVRTGLHNQSTFALGLALDWARIAGNVTLASRIEQQARHFFAVDRAAPLAYEPSGTDFFSPTLAEADLLRRVLPQTEFAEWLWGFLGEDALITLPKLLAPVQVVDFSDGQLAHFTGLNLSRAWMLAGIAAHLPADDLRRPLLQALTQSHGTAGLADALHGDYMVAHWTPTFALYLLSERGLA